MSATADKSNTVVTLRPSAKRGHADHGWLNTYHTFSFASYYDARFTNFHALRVLNEDRVSPGRGFGTHPHREAEIWSYPVRGALLHKDSMGNNEIIGRGTIQFTSAGTGISHSEYNGSEKEMVHFLQLWARPNKSGLKPGYQTKSFSDKDKEGKLCLVLAPFEAKDKKEETVGINADLRMYATLLKTGESVSLDVEDNHEVYVHLIQDSTGFDTEANKVGIDVCGTKLSGGDGAFLTRKDEKSPLKLTITGANAQGADVRAEVLVIDVLATDKGKKAQEGSWESDDEM